jgi:polyphenol oxidase
MLLHKGPGFSIYFGDARQQFFPLQLKEKNKAVISTQQTPFAYPARLMQLQNLIFLHQVHGAGGTVITDHETAASQYLFSHYGDFLITNLPGIGLGIATADCLSIIMHDPINRVVAAVHAGWRGSTQEVAVKALATMQTTFSTDPSQVNVFFGPSAKECCYEFGPELEQILAEFSYGTDALIRKETGLFFDVPLFNQRQLQAAGVPTSAFHTNYNFCTLCNHNFCSARRQKTPHGGRQMTIVALY